MNTEATLRKAGELIAEHGWTKGMQRNDAGAMSINAAVDEVIMAIRSNLDTPLSLRQTSCASSTITTLPF